MRSVEPPPKLRFKAPAAFRPVAGEPLAKAMPEFFRLQEQLLERIQGVSGLDLARAKTASPVIPLFKASLGQTFGIVLAHERRHLWQARQVRRAPDFPSS